MGSLDVLLIFGTALVSMLVSELVSWFFVYRTDKYARAVARTRKLAAELRDGETGPKRAAAVRAELKLLGGDTTGSNFKTMAFLGVIHWLTYSLLSRQYAGLVVARLPFEPLGLVQGMSHRGLVGQDHVRGFSRCALTPMLMLSLPPFKDRGLFYDHLHHGHDPAVHGPAPSRV